jgi:hypothetical protein
MVRMTLEAPIEEIYDHIRSLLELMARHIGKPRDFSEPDVIDQCLKEISACNRLLGDAPVEVMSLDDLIEQKGNEEMHAELREEWEQEEEQKRLKRQEQERLKQWQPPGKMNGAGES